MKDNLIYLEATGEKEIIKIGVYTPKDVIWRYDDIEVPLDKVKMRCREMIEMLNTTSRNGGGGSQAVEKIKSLGRMLGDELLTGNIKEKLRKTDATYLVLKIDDHLVDIPWELICINEEFLCHQFNIGRLVKTRQEISKQINRTLTRPLKMWILANPAGDLQVADAEGLKIFQEMVRLNNENEIIAPSLDSEVSRDEIKENLKGFDFVHFAGHVEYNSQNPAYSGWKLTNSFFSVTDIDKMSGGASMPSLIFSNACQSARNEQWNINNINNNTSFSLTNAFLRSGVKHYVGTSWEIMDEPGSMFAQEFYRLLSLGKTVGEAVRDARCSLTEKFGPDICWASYLLYGDPTVRYFREDLSDKNLKQNQRPSMSRQNTITRGGFLNYSFNTSTLNVIKTVILILFGVVLILVSVISGISIKNWFGESIVKTQESNLLEIQKLMIQRAEKQQQRTQDLFDTLTSITAGIVSEEKQSSDDLTMVTVFDSQSLKTGKEKIILYAIQDQIIQKQSNIKLLEQESFDIILEELIRNLKLTPINRREMPNILMPKLILIVEVHDAGASTLILMRMVEKQSRQILDTIFEELDNTKKILDQKEKLTKKLLQNFAKYEKHFIK